MLVLLALPILSIFNFFLQSTFVLSLCLCQYPDEEVERAYEEFYEDVHTEFLKFGEIINFKVLISPSQNVRYLSCVFCVEYNVCFHYFGTTIIARKT